MATPEPELEPGNQQGTQPAGALAERVRSLVREVPDFPLPGILFRDITPLLADAPTFAALVESWAQDHAGIDVVAGVEARGFIFAAPLAIRLGAGFVPVRKSGKLPGATERASYALEYGTATLEVTYDAFRAGQRVLLVDDVLATGGTAAAACELIERSGAEVAAVQVLVELAALGGRDRLAGRDVRATFAV
jgi:adenine phosphoribosyltransferase